jgi:hypothetical protein
MFGNSGADIKQPDPMRVTGTRLTDRAKVS